MVWGSLKARMGEPGAEGSPKVGEGEVGVTGAVKRGMVGMVTGKVKEVRGRSLPPLGWVGLKGSRSFY